MSRDLNDHGLVSVFVRHPNAANLLMVLMILFGLYGLAKINTQFFPTVETKRILITISWPGASAEDVEANILGAVEPEVRFVDGVDEITSSAREGSASIIMAFDPAADMQKALSDVESAVAQVTTLPEDAETPVIQFPRFFDRVARLSISGPFSEAAMRVYAKRIRDDLISRGIDQVNFNGMRDEEIHVEVPERELRRLGMTVGDIATKVAGNTRDLPSGQIRGPIEKQLRAVTPGETPEAIRTMEIKSFPTGERVRLREVASVERAFNRDDPRGFAFGEPGIEITVNRSVNTDTLQAAETLNSYLKEARSIFPPTLKIAVYDDRSDKLWERINLLFKNGGQGLILVVGILFVFLNARIALWVAAGIPVAMMATLGIMYASGQTINMMSLFALIMTLGIIVDDAIVVGEHTATRSSAGDDPVTAAERGAGRMITPVIAASLTTMAAFAPMFLIRDVIGQIMGSLPLVVIAVLVASLIECFFVLPGHLSHALGSRRGGAWSFWRQFFVALVLAVAVTIIPDGMHAAPVPGFTDTSASLAALKAAIANVEIWTVVAGAFGLLAALFADAVTWLIYGISLLLAGVSSMMTMLRGALAGAGFAIVVAAGAFAIAALIEWFISHHEGKAHNAHAEQRGFRRAFDRGFNAFRDGPFRRMVALSYHWRYSTVAIAVGLITLIGYGLVAGGRVGFVFFPSPEAESIRASVEFNAGIPEDEAIVALNRIETALTAAETTLSGANGEKLVVASFVTLGKSGRTRGDNVAEIDVQLTPSEDRTIRTPEIVKAWKSHLPDIAGTKRVAVFERRGGPPGRDIDIRLMDAPPAVLKTAAADVMELLSGFPGVSGVADDLPFGKPELVMELTPRGAALGFTIDEVGRQIRNAFEGAIARRLAVGDDEIVIRVIKKMDRKGDAQLRTYELRAPSGEFVPLSEVVSLSERQGFSVIPREDGRPVVSVTADVDSDITSNKEIIDTLNDGALAKVAGTYNLVYEFSGREEERKKSFADLQIGTGIALMVIYIILAWIFASYWRPLAVMLIIPFGFVGAVAGHAIMGFKLTILSMIGLLGLAGILVNDSIILVGRIDERLEEGDDLETSSIGASQDRLRAVLLTSLTTICGLAPLLMEKSLQAQFLLPMAITIVFGLGFATLLVLFLVPALIGIGGDISNSLKALYGRRHGHGGFPAE
ncbi:MAG: AcrB/AcrD/AcrF family protein [Hyphomicrobiales bacterium]|nr:MAG: AcrB/AcrD/AcrF family protein [Hyphomicrobiales bacterium]